MAGNSLGWLVVGVGINVRNALPSHTAPVATRLADFECGRRPSWRALSSRQ